ncbi:MAG: hypothetical protein ACREJF_06680, partial [Candidatus Methylomirabilales bacterium]
MRFPKYLKNVLLGLDQLGNTLIGGSPDETISSWSGRSESWIARKLEALLGKVEKEHSVRSLEY